MKQQRKVQDKWSVSSVLSVRCLLVWKCVRQLSLSWHRATASLKKTNKRSLSKRKQQKQLCSSTCIGGDCQIQTCLVCKEDWVSWSADFKLPYLATTPLGTSLDNTLLHLPGISLSYFIKYWGSPVNVKYCLDSEDSNFCDIYCCDLFLFFIFFNGRMVLFYCIFQPFGSGMILCMLIFFLRLFTRRIIFHPFNLSSKNCCLRDFLSFRGSVSLHFSHRLTTLFCLFPNVMVCYVSEM